MGKSITGTPENYRISLMCFKVETFVKVINLFKMYKTLRKPSKWMDRLRNDASIFTSFFFFFSFLIQTSPLVLTWRHSAGRHVKEWMSISCVSTVKGSKDRALHSGTVTKYKHLTHCPTQLWLIPPSCQWYCHPEEKPRNFRNKISETLILSNHRSRGV